MADELSHETVLCVTCGDISHTAFSACEIGQQITKLIDESGVRYDRVELKFADQSVSFRREDFLDGRLPERITQRMRDVLFYKMQERAAALTGRIRKR